MHEVRYTRAAERALRRMPRKVTALIRERVDEIAADPYSHHNNVSRLQGRAGYRLRIGDWRVVYTIQDDDLVILVVKIASRGEVYR